MQNAYATATGATGRADGCAEPIQEFRPTHSAARISLVPETTKSQSYGSPDPEATHAAERLRTRYGFRLAKRTFDVAFSALVFALLWWLFIIVAVAIKLDSPGPVFFKQERVGRDGHTFRMYKFRSMYADAEDRLAELPQFLNVLLGDMSVVGPRPALPREVRQYTPYQRRRLLVKPGITCYWQTRCNRDDISFDEWVGLDLLYIKQCSAWSDFKLIVQTVCVVLTAQGN